MYDKKLLQLLDTVIEQYITKGDPVGSKFLHSLDEVAYAPSTLRKYLNLLEKAGLVYQPYNSSGRIPTVQGLSAYLDYYMMHRGGNDSAIEVEVKDARHSLNEIVEAVGEIIDGVVVGFLKHDEYYFLGINNLLREDLLNEYETTKQIIDFVEHKKIMKLLDRKMMKHDQVYYTFITDNNTIISCLYAKLLIDGYDSVISVIGPTRVNYKRNMAILKKVLRTLQS